MAHSEFDMAAGETRLPIRVLTLTPFYPAEGDDGRGCFVAEPLPFMAGLEVDGPVFAVQPFYRGTVRPHPGAHAAAWQGFFAFPGGAGLPSAGAFLFAQLLAKVRQIHRDRPLQLIHAHAALPCGHAAALLSRELKIPFVVTVHGLDAFFAEQVSGLSGRWCRRVANWVYQSAARVVCISERVRAKVLEGVSARTVVVYNGVDPVRFSPGAENDVSDSILSVGNLIPIKGHELLLRALAAVQDQFPTVGCDLIGDGPERTRLTALAHDLGISGKVRFHGRQNREQVAQAMRCCLLFALPSRYEGLGCVYLEAMSAQKPVIACTGQGIEEVVQHGRNGWLIAPDSLPDITAALTALLSDARTRQQFGEEARRTILARYTLHHQAEMLARLYQGCIA
jgi:glycosyltransferase involved in cell wall biosynthesis